MLSCSSLTEIRSFDSNRKPFVLFLGPSLRQQDILPRNPEEELQSSLTVGQRLADRVANVGGSWKFITWFTVVFVVWILSNSVLLVTRPFDPYPFIFLNLVLSCLAAIQAPVIMMSQNRQEARDQPQGGTGDSSPTPEGRSSPIPQWERLVEIQEIQRCEAAGKDRTLFCDILPICFIHETKRLSNRSGPGSRRLDMQ